MPTIKKDSKSSSMPESKATGFKQRYVLALYTEGKELQSLFVQAEKNQVRVTHLATQNLLQPLNQVSQTQTTDIGGQTISAEDIFGPEEVKAPVMEQPESAGPESETLPITSNEELLASVFRQFPMKSFAYTVNLPASANNVIQVRDGYEKLRRKAARQIILSKINERLNNQIVDDHFDYLTTEDNNIFAFAYTGEIPLIELYESIQRDLKVRHRLVSILPNEVALSNLLRFNGMLAADETVIVINIGPEESQIVITRGGKIVQIGAAVRENYRSPALLQTLAGKILYEQNIGNLPDKFRLLLTGKARQLDALTFFKASLEIDDVEYFIPNPAVFITTPEVAEQLTDYAVLLGNAVTALCPQSPHITALQLLPDYIVRRQQVFKLAWHGYLLLGLIFLMPLIINHQYSQKARIQKDYLVKKNYLEQSIKELTWTETLRDSLAGQLTLNKKKLELLEKLAAGSYRFSYTLERIKAAIQECGGYLWLTDLTTTSEGIQLSGISLYRNRPPRLVARFPQASVLSVVPTEIRGATVYRFQVLITQITEDEKHFNPVVNIPKVTNPSVGLLNKKGAALWREGARLFAAKRYDQALEAFRLLQEDKSEPELQVKASFWYGKTAHILGRHQEAVRILKDFVAQHAEREEVWEAMLLESKSLLALGYNQEARELLLKIMHANPMSAAGMEAAQLQAQIQ